METKHFTSNDLPTKFAHKHWSSNTFWIILISVLFFLFLVVSKWNKIEEFFWLWLDNIQVESGFVLWEEVSVEWILTQDGDFVTHTHKLSTLSSWVFGLKSKKINLNQYSWTVLIEWIIDTEHQWLYIIDVDQIIAEFDEWISGDVQTWEIVPSGQYLPNIWIYLPPSFFEEYSIVSTGKNVFEVKSLISNENIKIDYFLCKKWDINNDCKKLSSNFANSNEKTFSTQYGTTFYKLAEVDSWFFANQELFGYFINNVPEQEVIKLTSYLTLPNNEYVKNMIEPQISSICKQWNIVMNQIIKSNLILEQSRLFVIFIGNWEKWTVECKLELDLSLPSWGTIKSFNYKEIDLSGSIQNETPLLDTTAKPTSMNTDIKQFPISLEKALVFTSGRWHSISFPSSKISYKSDSVSENLGLAWVNCYVATKVIEYSKKDLIDSEPSIIVYECKIKESVDLPNEYYQKPLTDWRTFVVSVIDSAWHDFANNIQVTLNE